MSGAERGHPAPAGDPSPAGSRDGREDDDVVSPVHGSPDGRASAASAADGQGCGPQPGGHTETTPAGVESGSGPGDVADGMSGPYKGDGGNGLSGRRRPGLRRGADAARGDRRGRGSFARELPVLILIAFVLALLIKAFLVQAFWIPTVSMERTLLVNDRVLVNKLVYRFRDVHRGEIVVFNGEGTGFEQAETFIEPPSNIVSRALRSVQGMLGLGAPSDKDFIKRVIGVGGDTVACCDPQGRVTVNGRALDESYIYENSPLHGGREFDPVKVPPGRLWVMGDHRGESSDSRVNGMIPESKVIGRAFVRVWPLDRMAILTPPDIFTAASVPVVNDLLPGSGASGAGAAMVVGVGAATLRRGRRRGRMRTPGAHGRCRMPGRATGDDGGGGPARRTAVHADQLGDST